MAFSFRDIWNSLRALSTLGRLQIIILLINVVVPIALINAISNFGDSLSMWIGMEFIVFSVIGIIFTVVVENPYAYGTLVFLQVQLCSFVTASAFIGILKKKEPLPLRLVIVVFNWLMLFAFFGLQFVVRKTWGWHAFHLLGSNPENVKLYKYYQMLNAAVVLDLFHVLFFVTVEEIFLNKETVGDHIFVLLATILTILLFRVLQLSLRKEKALWVAIISVIYLGGLVCFMFYAIRNTKDLLTNLPMRTRAKDFSSQGEEDLVVAIEWCVVCVRLIVLYAILRSTVVFGRGLAQFFPSSSSGGTIGLLGGDQHNNGGYLIDPEVHIQRATKLRAQSVPGEPLSPVIVPGAYNPPGGHVTATTRPTNYGTAINYAASSRASGTEFGTTAVVAAGHNNEQRMFRQSIMNGPPPPLNSPQKTRESQVLVIDATSNTNK